MLDILQSLREKEERRRARSVFENLKTRLPEACCPPCRAARTTVREQRPEGELDPRFLGDHHQQKVTAGLYDAGGFSECLIDPLPIEVIDRICADDGVEGSAFEWQFAHVSRFDCGALCHTSGFQVCQQSLLRTFTMPEVLLEGVSEEVQSNNRRPRTSFENHDGRSTRAGAYIKDSSRAGTKKPLRRQRTGPIDANHEVCDQKCSP
jgi:hypothetical protein